jgi:ankyrin repeat protein
MSPLDYAAMHNNVELVKLLMDYGAKVMTVDKSPPVR